MKPFDRIRFPLMGLALLTLLAAMWGGLVRVGWRFPPIQPLLPGLHGALMISGFLGTLIGLERAAAFAAGNRPTWLRVGAYLGPLLTGLGALLSLAGVQGPGVVGLLWAGSLCLVLIYFYIVHEHPAVYTVLMGLGALSWLVGSSLWFFGQPVHQLVNWWAGFLVLTIVGERLELGRLSRVSGGATALLLAAVALFGLGQVIWLQGGRVLVALGWAGMALWLFRYDISRYTIRKTGLPRFVAVCLLAGYAWLLAGGLLLLWGDPGPVGLRYDAYLHAIFVGFIMSMIFGHAPIILPALTGRMVTFHARLYAPLALLHGSLVLRWLGDLLPNGPLRTWGALLNATAVLVYLGLVVYGMLSNRQT